MKDYVKMFLDLQSADGYVINDIPFIATVSSQTPQNVRCTEANRKIEVTGDIANVVIASQKDTLERIVTYIRRLENKMLPRE